MHAGLTLRVRPVATAALTPAQVDAMWRLYAEFYAHVEHQTFDRDLAEKTLVFLGTDAATGDIVGFSTALFYEHRFHARRVGVYFSGDTIIRPQYWGQTSLHRAVLRELLRWRWRHPFTPLYWHLICSGCRTYLTLVRNFPTHWPHHRRSTPERVRGLIDSICRARYGPAWHRDRGVVSFGDVQPVLKAAVAPVTAELRALPEIAFFLNANPGYLRGDELAMIARVDARAVRRMLGKWLRRALLGRRDRRSAALMPRASGLES